MRGGGGPPHLPLIERPANRWGNQQKKEREGDNTATMAASPRPSCGSAAATSSPPDVVMVVGVGDLDLKSKS